MRASHAMLLVVLTGAGCDGPGPDPTPDCTNPFVAADGLTVLWFSRGPFLAGIPLVTDDLVVTGGQTGVVRAFDRKACALKWRADVGGNMLADGPPLEVGGVIVVPQQDFVALDAGTGALRWRFPGEMGLAGEGTPVASGDTIFAATRFGWVYAVSAGSGSALWKRHFDSLAIFHPTVAGDALILGTRGVRAGGSLGAGYVIALNKADGTERWRFPLPDSAGIPGGAINSGLAVNGMVVIGSMTTRLYALDVASGALVWEQAPEVPKVGPSSDYQWAPRMFGETLIVTRSDRVTEARSPTDGSLRWTLDQGVNTSVPAISNGLAYFFNGELAVVDESGRRVWSGGGQGTPVRRAYLHGTVTDDGTIYSVAFNWVSGGGSNDLLAMRLPDLR